MVRRVGRRRLQRHATFITVFALVLPIGVRSAAAFTDVVEQRWELLAETNTLSRSATMRIYRGTLPGGTSAFDPQPTATFEVVGRHTGGAVGSRYDVALRAPQGVVLAVASFPATMNANFIIRTGPLSWPSVDKDLKELQITKVDDGLNLAGTLQIQKA